MSIYQEIMALVIWTLLVAISCFELGITFERRERRKTQEFIPINRRGRARKIL